MSLFQISKIPKSIPSPNPSMDYGNEMEYTYSLPYFFFTQQKIDKSGEIASPSQISLN